MAQTTPKLNVVSRAGVSYHLDSAATHTVATLTTQKDTAYHITATFVMQEVGAESKVSSVVLMGTFYNDGGTVTQQGTTTSVHAEEGITGTKTAGISSTGSDALINFTVLSDDTTSVIVRVKADVFVIGGDTAPHEFGSSDNA